MRVWELGSLLPHTEEFLRAVGELETYNHAADQTKQFYLIGYHQLEHLYAKSSRLYVVEVQSANY